MECFRRDAREIGIALKVLAADLNPEKSAACQKADAFFRVPRCTDPEFIPVLLRICHQQKISLIIPTIDTELQVLADHQREFLEIGVRVSVSLPEVVRIARDKLETARFLNSVGVRVPRTDKATKLLEDPSDWDYPIILKPTSGSSSIGISTIESIAELGTLRIPLDDYIAQEKWQGDEYTVNVYFDPKGNMKCAIPHLRFETRTGEVSKAIVRQHPMLVKVANRLGETLEGARGVLCFQAIVNEKGQSGVFEINARFGGGYPLAHKAGAHFSRWLLEESLGETPSYTDAWEADLLMLRYDAAVFVSRGAGSEEQPDE